MTSREIEGGTKGSDCGQTMDVKDLLNKYNIPFTVDKNNDRVWCKCPIHGGDNPKAFVFDNITKKYKCFSRGCSGDFADFIREMGSQNND
jgi:DNA primase